MGIMFISSLKNFVDMHWLIIINIEIKNELKLEIFSIINTFLQNQIKNEGKKYKKWNIETKPLL